MGSWPFKPRIAGFNSRHLHPLREITNVIVYNIENRVLRCRRTDMETTKESYIRHLSKLVSGAMKEVERAHGQLLPESVAKRVAAQLWGETLTRAHASDAEWIRHVRGSLGYTQAQLAAQLGTSQVTVARWETGASKPSPYYRRAIMLVAQQLR